MKLYNEYTFEQIEIGHTETFSVLVTPDMEDKFRDLTGDVNPLHRDDDYAADIGNGLFSTHVTFGMLTASLLSTFAGVYLPGKYSLIHSVEIGFQKPVYAGDELTVTGMCSDKSEAIKVLLLKVVIRKQDGSAVLKAKMKVKVLK